MCLSCFCQFLLVVAGLNRQKQVFASFCHLPGKNRTLVHDAHKYHSVSCVSHPQLPINPQIFSKMGKTKRCMPTSYSYLTCVTSDCVYEFHCIFENNITSDMESDMGQFAHAAGAAHKYCSFSCTSQYCPFIYPQILSTKWKNKIMHARTLSLFN